jgi:recA bacterial DNA recombination protein
VRSEPAIANPRVDKLRELLLEAGLTDRVRVGAPCPPAGTPPVPRTHRTANERPSTPGTEEGFSPDTLLRPHSREAAYAGEGRLIEVNGARSSGKTALAYRLAADATARGALVGWVDLPNALDPRFLLRAKVRLEDVLWVRPPDLQAALRSAELLIKTGFALVVLDLESARPRELGQLGASVWTRLLRALRESRATALLLGTQRAAGSFATLGVSTTRERALFDAGLFEGLASRLEVLRSRTGTDNGELSFAVYQRS